VRGGPVAIKRAPRRLRLTKFARDKNARKNRQRIFPVTRIPTYMDRTCIQLTSNFEEPSPLALLIQFRSGESVLPQTHAVEIIEKIFPITHSRIANALFSRKRAKYLQGRIESIWSSSDSDEENGFAKVSSVRNPWMDSGEQEMQCSDFIHGDLITRSSRQRRVSWPVCQRAGFVEGLTIYDRSRDVPWDDKRADIEGNKLFHWIFNSCQKQIRYSVVTPTVRRSRSSARARHSKYVFSVGFPELPSTSSHATDSRRGKINNVRPGDAILPRDRATPSPRNIYREILAGK